MGRLQVNSNIDLYFNNVSLLLPFDNNFQDYSKNNFSVTVNGNVQISNVQSKFGGSSAYFNGSEIYLSQETMDYLSIPNNLATRLGTDPFTIEAWVYSTKSLQANSMGTIITQAVVDEGFGNNTGWFLSVYQGNVLFRPSSGGNFITTSLSNPLINRWAHVALVGNGSSIKLYVDGILEGQYNSSVNMNLALDVRPDTPTLIGAYETGIPNQGSFRGYINDLRITKGIARYTSNFTPPSKLPLNINNKISIKKQNLGGGKLLAARSFLPNDLNGLSLWLRADAGVTYDGSNNVSAWADQSGNGKNATATGTQRPLYVSSDINGMPVISFDGVDDRLIGPNVISSTPCTIIVVAKFSNSEEIGMIFQQYGTYDNIALYRGFNGGTSRQFRLYNGANLTSSATTNDNQAYIFEAIVNGSNSYLYLNGSQTAFGNAGNLIPEGNYYLGYWRGGNAARTMKIAEVIVYNRAITTQERQQVESYLNAKYNIY